MTLEVNFDGLVGPTHNYAGLSLGNIASQSNAGDVSNPKAAALQGIAKMRKLHSLGLVQGVLPPPLRPDPRVLARLGFDSIEQVQAVAPQLVAMLMSASPMWSANAATVSPSIDAHDGRLHLTPANLVSTNHRALEPDGTARMLGKVFDHAGRFVVHAPLPATAALADEGAANHGRICTTHGDVGHHLFVYGREATEPTLTPGGFPRRQSKLAGELIANAHGLDPRLVTHARQSSEAIDAGAFHNDVVSVVNEDVLFTHERAFEDPVTTFLPPDCRVVEVAETDVPLTDAISSYLFNSQLVTLPDDTMVLIAPAETDETSSTAAYLKSAVEDPANPIVAVETMDLR
ncbi:MAG: N-succinylarginine dihydrolase, partial [Acidimicrobiia bacterium]